MDKILRIKMGADAGPQVKEEPLGDYAGLGGRAMTSAIVAKEVPPLCHPLGADNKLIIAPGLLSGTTAAMSGRISVGCKSPLTGGIKEANAGGQASQVLARLGYAAIVLEGKPKDDTLYKVLINKDGVTVTADTGDHSPVEPVVHDHPRHEGRGVEFGHPPAAPMTPAGFVHRRHPPAVDAFGGTAGLTGRRRERVERHTTLTHSRHHHAALSVGG